jgi:hypothetical protein
MEMAILQSDGQNLCFRSRLHKASSVASDRLTSLFSRATTRTKGNSRPNRFTARFCQASSPNCRPRCTLTRDAPQSPTASATNSTVSCGRLRDRWLVSAKQSAWRIVNNNRPTSDAQSFDNGRQHGSINNWRLTPYRRRLRLQGSGQQQFRFLVENLVEVMASENGIVGVGAATAVALRMDLEVAG